MKENELTKAKLSILVNHAMNEDTISILDYDGCYTGKVLAVKFNPHLQVVLEDNETNEILNILLITIVDIIKNN